MRPYRPRYTPEVAGRIRKLHPEVKREIHTAIRSLLSAPLLGQDLQFDLSGYHSYRMRTYRIIYRINDDDAMLDVVFIGPRRTVYEELKSLLKKRE